MSVASLTSGEVRGLKARAQHLEPVVHVGKQGLSEGLVQSTNQALADHELIKVRFTAAKDRESKRANAAALAEQTNAALVTIVGHVAVLYRPRPTDH